MRIANMHAQPDVSSRFDEVDRMIWNAQSALLDTANPRKRYWTSFHTTDVQFLYEIINCVEPDFFSETGSDAEDAWLRISLSRPCKVLVESNVDSFGEHHFRAICKAWNHIEKVQLRVKHDSFSIILDMTKLTSLGDFIPIRQAKGVKALDESTGSRMTVFLKNTESYTRWKRNFTEIPDTILLMNQHLQRLSINIEGKDHDIMKLEYSKTEIGREASSQKNSGSKILSDEEAQPGLVEIERVIDAPNSYRPKRTRFHTFRRFLHGLPFDKARVGADGYRIREWDVFLAFPVTPEGSPVVLRQTTFASIPLDWTDPPNPPLPEFSDDDSVDENFANDHAIWTSMPLEDYGFTFLIQSDFILQPKSKAICSFSKRNAEILNGIAKAFCDAVLELCKYPSIKYQWTKFIPRHAIFGFFWFRLRSKIIDLLRQKTVFLPQSGQGYRLSSELRKVNPKMCDRSGVPLLADLRSPLYLSIQYDLDSELRKELGIRSLSLSEFLDRLEADVYSKYSRWKANSVANNEAPHSSNRNWYLRVCKVLLEAFQSQSAYCQRIFKIKLIPLQDGRFVDASSTWNSLYFPDSEGVPIPSDPLFSSHALHPAALNSSKQRELYDHLGVLSYDPSAVAQGILETFKEYKPGKVKEARLDWEDLQYLVSCSHYLHSYGLDINGAANPHIPLVDENMIIVDVNEHVYYPHKQQYGPVDMLGLSAGVKATGSTAGHHAHFLHPEYLKPWPQRTSRGEHSWAKWLKDAAGVKWEPQLLDPCGVGISSELRYIAKHCGEKLVGMLSVHHESYKPYLLKARDMLGKSSVLLENCSTAALETTILPLPHLKEAAEKFNVRNLPFIRLPKTGEDESLGDWMFLEQFGVITDASLKFHLLLLRQFVDLHRSTALSHESEDHIFQLYGIIASLSDSDNEAKMIRYHFEEARLLYIPHFNQRHSNWRAPKDCVWNGPDFLRAYRVLSRITEYTSLENFVRNVLCISDATSEDPLSHLRGAKVTGNFDQSEISDFYRRLYHDYRNDSQWPSVRSIFAKDALIRDPHSGRWLLTEDCIWADAPSYNKTPIRTDYYDLEDFFVRMLQVPVLNPRSKTASLKWASKRNDIDNVKDLILSISRMSPEVGSLKELEEEAVFPVKLPNGARVCSNKTADFAVLDHPMYEAAFEGKLNTLDFSAREFHQIRPFIEACGLQDRNLSNLVREETRALSSEQSPDLTNLFRTKARAFYWCAAHYRSPKWLYEKDRLLSQLLSTTVFLSACIERTMTVKQDSNYVTVGDKGAHLHIVENGDALELYLPKELLERELCMLRVLPNRVCKILSVSCSRAELIVSAILNAKTLDIVNAVLKEAGIICGDASDKAAAGVSSGFNEYL